MYKSHASGVRRRLLFSAAATVATAGAFGLAASPALADQTITVPCAGNPLTSGPQGLVNAVNAANTYGAAHPGQKTTINVVNNCAYDFIQPYSDGEVTQSPDGSPTALPQITSTIVIKGQGGPDEPAIIMRSVQMGTLAFRLIDVATTGKLTLNSIQVSNGLTPNGANGSCGTSPDMNGCPGADGGGIFSSGTLTLQDSVVSGNATGNGGNGGTSTAGNANGGNGGNGGGIYNNGGTVTTNGGDNLSGNVTGNGGNGGMTTGTGTANGGSGGHGGGIATATNGTDNLQDNTTLDSNSTGNGGMGGTTTGSGTANGGDGGDGGSSSSASGSTVKINGGHTYVEISNTGTGGGAGTSVATSKGGAPGDGGGLYTEGVVSTNGTNFTENVAGGQEQSTSGTGNGGGLAAEKGAKVTIQKGSFTWNVAGDGGAIFHDASSPVTVSGTMFANNTPNNCSPLGTVPGCTG